jgi:hypothetical protein
MDKLFEIRIRHYESGDVCIIKYYIPIDVDGRMNMSQLTVELGTDYQIMSIKPLRNN